MLMMLIILMFHVNWKSALKIQKLVRKLTQQQAMSNFKIPLKHTEQFEKASLLLLPM